MGGLIGLSTTPAVNTSFATGAVSGATMVGGLIGNRGSGTTDTMLSDRHGDGDGRLPPAASSASTPVR